MNNRNVFANGPRKTFCLYKGLVWITAVAHHECMCTNVNFWHLKTNLVALFRNRITSCAKDTVFCHHWPLIWVGWRANLFIIQIMISTMQFYTFKRSYTTYRGCISVFLEEQAQHALPHLQLRQDVFHSPPKFIGLDNYLIMTRFKFPMLVVIWWATKLVTSLFWASFVHICVWHS